MCWFNSRASRPTRPPQESAGSDDPVLDAWNIHLALSTWTSNVDQKASFALAIESAILVATAGFTTDGSLFGSLDRCAELVTYFGGVLLLFAAVICAGNVVKPRLRGRATRREWHNNYIYFGHLRHWDPADLTRQLKSGKMLESLAAQLVVMSEIAWTKHRFVQLSMWLALAGFMSLGTCAWLAG